MLIGARTHPRPHTQTTNFALLSSTLSFAVRKLICLQNTRNAYSAEHIPTHKYEIVEVVFILAKHARRTVVNTYIKSDQLS